MLRELLVSADGPDAWLSHSIANTLNTHRRSIWVIMSPQEPSNNSDAMIARIPR